MAARKAAHWVYTMAAKTAAPKALQWVGQMVATKVERRDVPRVPIQAVPMAAPKENKKADSWAACWEQRKADKRAAC